MVRLYTINFSLGPSQIFEVNSRIGGIRGIGGIGKDLTKNGGLQAEKGIFRVHKKEDPIFLPYKNDTFRHLKKGFLFADRKRGIFLQCKKGVLRNCMNCNT